MSISPISHSHSPWGRCEQQLAALASKASEASVIKQLRELDQAKDLYGLFALEIPDVMTDQDFFLLYKVSLRAALQNYTARGQKLKIWTRRDKAKSQGAKRPI